EIEFNQASYRVHESQLDFWTPNNPNANHSTLHYLDNASSPILGWTGGDSYSGYSTWIRDRFWRKADYIRLKEIYLAYNFNVEKIKKATGISRFTVYASGNNVFTFTKLVEGDPERKDFSKGFYPQMSTYKLGIKVSF
ncbi:MAG: SusC/RagA family TonB-linked outer membrane protein, partial [Tannerellaceae bacterium]